MKKLIFSMMLGVAAVMTANAQDYNYLTVQKSDGTKVSFLSWSTNITFSGGNMIVTEDGFTKTFALNDLSKMYFGNDGVNAIQTVADSARPMAGDGEVFDLQGRRVAAQRHDKLPKGVYIVKKEGKSVKITVK